MKFFFIYEKITLLLTKDEILCAFLNTGYFGQGIYGISAASHYYLSKSIKQLTVAECATLMTVYAYTSGNHSLPEQDRLVSAQEWLLEYMLQLSMISPEVYEQSIKEGFHLFNYKNNHEE